MISDIEKNKIDLYKLKNENDLQNVENAFNLFLKKNITKKKYFSKIRKCACGSKKFTNSFDIGFFKYIRCQCETYFVSPMPKDNFLDIIYSNKGPYSLYRKKFLENKKKKRIRSGVINRRKIDQISLILKDKKKLILDFGCGDGGFLKLCKKHGYKNLYGVDTKYKNILQKDGITFSDSLKNFKLVKKFDCIVLWGVLEHLNNPVEFSKNIFKYLKKGGHVFLEAPNSNSLLMNFLSMFNIKVNRFIEPGRHLYFFSQKFFHIYSKKLKFKLIDLETNGLDLQTLIGPTNDKLTKKILMVQNSIDRLNFSDHFRAVFQKK